jgi:hypothetical protein
MANVPSADTPTANFGTPWDLVPLYTNSSNLFTIGNGTSNITGPTSSPSNAFVVDVWGNTQTNRLTISGPNTGLPVGQTASVPNGISATTTGTTNTIGATAANSVTIGSWNNVSGENSIVTGIANNNLSGGQHCIIAGITNRTESPGAIAVGINAWATAAWSHAFGGGPTADPCLAMGGYSGAAGHGITASGFAENVVGVFNVPFFNPFPPTTPPETIPIHTTAQNLFTIGNGSGGGTFPPGWLIGSPGISQRSNAFCVDALARTYVTRLIVGDRTKTGTPAFQQNPNPVDPPNDDMIPLAQTPAGIECATLLPFPNNAAAIAGGLTVGSFYRTGGDPDLVCVVH